MNSLKLTRTVILAGLAATVVAVAAPAVAADDADTLPRGVLVLHGADLTSSPAVAHLKQRLRHIATEICTANSSGQIMNRDEQACYATAVSDGLAQIDSRQQQALRERAVRVADTGTGGSVR